MNKRHVLFLTAVLGMASPFALAQNAAAPDPQLKTAPITVETGTYNGPLSSLLAAIAKAAGYGLILDTNVDQLQSTPSAGTAAPAAQASAASRPVVYSFQNKPFNEVWPLLMDVYGLSYEIVQVGGQPVLRVGNAPIQRIVTLKNVDAVEASNQAKLFFGTPVYNENPQKDAQGNVIGMTRTLADVKIDSATLRIVPDIRSNSVIVRGTNKEVAEVERALAQLDRADAPRSTTAASNNVQTVYIVKGKQADVVTLMTAQFPDLKVTPVGETGQLVLFGVQSRVNAALELLGRVDVAPSSVSGENQTQRIYQVKGNQKDTQDFLTAQFPSLRVLPVGSTGQLVISGSSAQVTAALNLLAEVDRGLPTAASTVQKVFQLVNASAEEVKATLEGTLSRELMDNAASNANGALLPTANPISALTGEAAAGTTPAATPAAGNAAPAQAATAGAKTEVTIIADKRTNTLIVRGTTEQVAQVAELIPQLDQKVPQINVQVRIQEITQSAGRSLGVNWNASFGGFSVSAGGGGLSAAFDPTRSLVGFNIFPTLTALENQGLTKSIYDGSITMQSGQRALGANTNTQNVSSTAAATIKSGGRLEINIPSAAANVPAIQKQIDYGVNLDFFNPQVAPDGTITMRVRGQINDLTTAVNASTVPNLLQFTNSEAQTTLSLKNGETVLLSGLLKHKETRNNDGVPFLSSLPVVGALFGKQSTKKEETQLLVIITGNVVK